MPAYPPAGHGSHLFVRFEKHNLTTREAIARLSKAFGTSVETVGVAGQKDKHAVTTQWASFPDVASEVALQSQLPDIRVLSAVPHPHKLRTGHLRANRFILRIRQPADTAAVGEVLAQLEQHGVPNYFGEQRFGIAGRNVTRARAMLGGDQRPPRDRFERKLLMSSIQAAIFNEWLAARIRDGLFARPIPGELLRKEDSGGLFVNEDQLEAERRMRTWEVSPTGPMFGAKMRHAQGAAAERERDALASCGVDLALLERHPKYGEGTRRVARVRPRHCTFAIDSEGIELGFELPSGAYATSVLREIMKPEPGVDTASAVHRTA